MALAGLIENRRQPEGWPNSLRVPEARWNVDRADKGQGYEPDPRQGWSSTADRLHCRARAGEPCDAAWQTFHAIARAFSWSIFRAARSALRFWLASVLTCTGWNKPTRIICAIPRASLRSL